MSKVIWAPRELTSLTRELLRLWKEEPEYGFTPAMLQKAQESALPPDRRRKILTWSAAKELHVRVTKEARKHLAAPTTTEVLSTPLSPAAPEERADSSPVDAEDLAKKVAGHLVSIAFRSLGSLAMKLAEAVSPSQHDSLPTPEPQWPEKFSHPEQAASKVKRAAKQPPAPLVPDETEPPVIPALDKPEPEPEPAAAPEPKGNILVMLQTARDVQNWNLPTKLKDDLQDYDIHVRHYVGTHPRDIEWDKYTAVVAPATLPSVWNQLIREALNSDKIGRVLRYSEARPLEAALAAAAKKLTAVV